MSAGRAEQHHCKDTPRLPLKGYDHQRKVHKSCKKANVTSVVRNNKENRDLQATQPHLSL